MPARVYPPSGAAELRALLAGDVVDAAAGLLGCRIATPRRTLTIVETEAYHQSEPACHGFGGHTARAQKLRRAPGHSYVYLSYGIHRLMNVVAGSTQEASGILLRGGVERQDGVDELAFPGPGRFATALGIALHHDGIDLLASSSAVQLLPAEPGVASAGQLVVSAPRVGITKAVDLPWRFVVAGSPGVSRPRPAGWRHA